ncbi:MAG: sigma-54-dependent Fis family transcriptional regulator [Deltaproteobacteria bacterium]|nr:sigma-54-dependent Fis family transcriptional regulator [Deltaproteobacteria bacterium]
MHRVLIADDESPLRMALDRFVRSLGMEAECVASGHEALEKLSHCDLLLSDVRMPGMDGLQLLAQARRRRPELPVVLITGHGTISLAVEAMRAGAANFLTKPFDLQELEEVIRAALESSMPPRALGPGPRTATTSADALVGGSEAMCSLRALVTRVATSDATVLITGESGSGKEVVARAIHGQSRRARGNFVAVNCGAIPEALLESELFGHVKGAFTGATQARAGHFAVAEGGTLLLDEIGELPLAMQVKLLRVLQDRAYTPVGGSEPKPADVRVIVATHRDLDSMVQSATFREDLYYRLNVLHVAVPSLRERGDDVLLLARTFLARTSAAEGRLAMVMDQEVEVCLRRYPWPGNVRELEHAITRATVLAQGDTLTLADLPPKVRGAFSGATHDSSGARSLAGSAEDLAHAASKLPETGVDLKHTLEQLERELIEQALERTGGNKNRAAALLRLNRTTLVEKLKRL